MKKLQYIQPSIRVIELDEQEDLLQTSTINNPIPYYDEEDGEDEEEGGVENGSGLWDF